MTTKHANGGKMMEDYIAEGPLGEHLDEALNQIRAHLRAQGCDLAPDVAKRVVNAMCDAVEAAEICPEQKSAA